MIRVIVQIQLAGDSVWHDLEVPAEVPVKQLGLQIAESMAWGSGRASFELTLHPSRRVLGPTESLAEAGIWDGSAIVLRPGAVADDPLAEDEPCLEASSGRAFRLGSPETIIGRGPTSADMPYIDLGGEPGGNTVSHDHARLTLQGDSWVIKISPQAKNSSFLDGALLQPSKSYLMTQGARLQLGNVTLTFLHGKADQ